MIILTWEKNCCKWLPMIISNSPDIFQQKMHDLFHGCEFIGAYINDPLVLTKVDWADYVHKLEITLSKLKEKWLKCNIKKYSFRKTEIEYSDFWVTDNGVKNIDKKYKQ